MHDTKRNRIGLWIAYMSDDWVRDTLTRLRPTSVTIMGNKAQANMAIDMGVEYVTYRDYSLHEGSEWWVQYVDKIQALATKKGVALAQTPLATYEDLIQATMHVLPASAQSTSPPAAEAVAFLQADLKAWESAQWQKPSPYWQTKLRNMAHDLHPRVYLMLTNEPSRIQSLDGLRAFGEHEAQLMRWAQGTLNRRLAVGCFAVGTLQPEHVNAGALDDWNAAREAGGHLPNPHEYTVTGNAAACFMPNYPRNLTQAATYNPANWPDARDTGYEDGRYLMGRYEAIMFPRYGPHLYKCGEWGPDTTLNADMDPGGSIKHFFQRYHYTAHGVDYHEIPRGYITLYRFVTEFLANITQDSGTGETPLPANHRMAEYMLQCTRWADQHLYSPYCVGLDLFAANPTPPWGTSAGTHFGEQHSGMVEFMTMHLPEYAREIEAGSPTAPPPAPPDPEPEPDPDDKRPALNDPRWARHKIHPRNTYANVRDYPTVGAGIIATIEPGGLVTQAIFRQRHNWPDANGVNHWIPIQLNGRVGFVRDDVVTVEDYAPTEFDLLSYFFVPGLVRLTSNEFNRSRLMAGRVWWNAKNGNAEQKGVVGGANPSQQYIAFGTDTSESETRYYIPHTRHPNGTLMHGVPWFPRMAQVGQSHTFEAHVQHFDKQTGQVQNSGDVTWTIKLVAHHASMTINGITLADVLEFHSFQGDQLREITHLAPNLWIVRWEGYGQINELADREVSWNSLDPYVRNMLDAPLNTYHSPQSFDALTLYLTDQPEPEPEPEPDPEPDPGTKAVRVTSDDMRVIELAQDWRDQGAQVPLIGAHLYDLLARIADQVDFDWADDD